MYNTVAELGRGLDSGIYGQAKQDGVTVTKYLENMAEKGEISNEIIDMNDPKRKNSAGKTLNGLQQVFAAAGYEMRGENTASVETIFTDNTLRVLFPEFLAQPWRDYTTYPSNMIRTEDLVSTYENVKSNSYIGFKFIPGQEDLLGWGRVNEGAEVPVYSIVDGQVAIKIPKYAARLRVTYEVMRRMSLDLVARNVIKLRAGQDRARTRAALAIALNGDGNSNPAINYASAGANLALADLVQAQIRMMTNFGGNPSFMVGDAIEVANILALPAITDKDTTANMGGFRDDGIWPRVLGMNVKMTPGGSALDGTKKTMFVDKQDGLIEVRETDSIVEETQKIIDHQFEEIVMSENVTWAKPSAVAFITVTRP